VDGVGVLIPLIPLFFYSQNNHSLTKALERRYLDESFIGDGNNPFGVSIGWQHQRLPVPSRVSSG